jgi:hypothetical protein
MMILIFGLITSLFCWYVFSPLFDRSYRGKRLDFASSGIENLRLRKQEILGAINDLEYDMKMQKMSPADYQLMKEKLLREGAEVLEALHKAKTIHSNQKLKLKDRRVKKAVA